MLYRNIIRPILFKTDPEKIHDFILKLGNFFGKSMLMKEILSIFFIYKHKSLNQTIDGVEYENPIGLAAGFDKDANLTQILPSVGFGFEEIGSVTAQPCEGNSRPRLWRLPKYKSLVVYYGLKNIGSEAIAKRLQNKKLNFPLGISIAKTNCKETADSEKAIQDYYQSFVTLEPFADYVAINISCPNAFGGQPFTSPELLDQLLTKLDAIKSNKPRYIKLSPDLSKGELDVLISVSGKHSIQGFIISNLVKNREKLTLPLEAFSKVGEGGLSGKPVEEFANSMISYVYRKTEGRFTIIGCGGIFNARDAYQKIRLGASLVQLITGMIYEGPALIRRINKDLSRLLQKDGFSTLSEAIGSDNKTFSLNKTLN